MRNFWGYSYLLVIILVVVSCSKQTGTVNTAQLSDYLPLHQGKMIRYRLDSTRFIDFGQRDTVISYDAKDVIESEITDNIGRNGFKVVRYLRSLSSTNEA